MSSPDAFEDWVLGNLWTLVLISGLTGYFGGMAYRYWTGKPTGWRITAVVLVAWFLSVKIAVMGVLLAVMIKGMMLRYRKGQSEPAQSPVPADPATGPLAIDTRAIAAVPKGVDSTPPESV